MTKTIAVTGGAGQIAYQLLFRIASGELFGKKTPVRLHILEVPEAIPSLEGVVMELEDGCYPLLKGVMIGSDPYKIFYEADLAILVGAKPRTLGMQRQDLLLDNAAIFKNQGLALQEVAKKDCTVLVVGNPCNTNAYIVQKFAPKLKNVFAMTRLDENRARQMLASSWGISVEEIHHLAIWGNHSSTMVPDGFHVKPSSKIPTDWKDRVRNRGQEVIVARGKSSAASAAQAIIDTLCDIYFPKGEDHWHSLALKGVGNPYGIDEDLVFSYPCVTREKTGVEIVKNLIIPEELQKEMMISALELQKEKEVLELF